jgi:hypothetical protein
MFGAKKNAACCGVERKALLNKEDTKKGVWRALKHHRTPLKKSG